MAILEQNVMVGSTDFVPTAGAIPEARPSIDGLVEPASTALFQQYAELRDATALMRHPEGEDLEAIRTEVGAWLASDRPELQPPANAAPEDAATERIGALATHLLRRHPNSVRLFDLHTTEALLEAARVHGEEVAAGASTVAPNLGADGEQAMPILRYVPQEQRAELLRGTPEYVAALATPPVPETVPEPRAPWRTRIGRRVMHALVGRWRADAAQTSSADPELGTADAAPVMAAPAENENAAAVQEQLADDAAVRERLALVRAFTEATGQFPENVDFFLCADPEEIGISHESLADMERRGYQNSGYGDRAEGKQLFDDAFRGYSPEDRMGGLRFVIVAQTDPATGERTPVAFFDYFKVRHNLFPEVAETAEAFVAANGLTPAPARYIVSKLVADPSRAKEMRDLHRYALVGTIGALASTSENGIFMETQAQPATRRMVRKHGATYLPGLQILLDQPLPDDGKGAGERSKLLLYLPPTES